MRRRVERVVVADERERHAEDRQEAAAAGVGHLRHVLGELLSLEELRDRNRFLGFLVDHDRHADAAVRVAAAGQLAEFLLGAVRHVGPVGEAAHERNREPVADRLADAGLVLHVVREVRQRVALRRAALRRHLSSRPVNDTGWNERKLIFFGLSSANSMMRPTCSLLTPLTIVTTGTMSTPALCRFSIARSLTSNRLPTRRCALAALPMPSNCR